MKTRSFALIGLASALTDATGLAGVVPAQAARFSNPAYDMLSKQYIAALDLSSQRSIAQQIETLLLDATPIIYAYFYDFLTATAKNITGVYPTGIGMLFLYNAGTT